MSGKQVTVIIPNYNGLKFLGICLDALEHQTFRDFEILVVDNGSSDGSVEWLKEQGIPAVFLPENTGFSGAVNAGIRAASTPYVLLLNNDTEAAPDFVGELYAAIRRSGKIFAVSSKMVQMYRRELMDDAGDMYSLMGWAYQRGVGRSSRGYNRPMEVFSACAGADLPAGRIRRDRPVRRDAFRLPGGHRRLLAGEDPRLSCAVLPEGRGISCGERNQRVPL